VLDSWWLVVTHNAQHKTLGFQWGENGEKYYGQLEEIIEVRYPNQYSTVLFRCKWFDTRGGRIRFENNITIISTEKEWDKEDQLIFASQAKQVFYIREPRQNNNHWWVVENVHHRKIWDLPLNDGRAKDIQHVDDVGEDVDVLDNISSSNNRLFIDFRQYNMSRSTYVTEGENASEVNPPTVSVNEESEGEPDYHEDDSDYEEEGSERDNEKSEEEFD